MAFAWENGDVPDEVVDAGATGTARGKINEYGGMPETFRGLHLRTHPDQDVSARKIKLVRADYIVMQDAVRCFDWTNFDFDMTSSGVDGFINGSEASSEWVRILAIRKASDGSRSLVGLRAPKTIADTSNTTTTDVERKLRLSTGTAAAKLSQGITIATGGKLVCIVVKLIRVGSPTGRIWFTLNSNNGGVPSATVLATSDKITCDAIHTSEQEIAFVFRGPDTTVASTVYHLVLEGDYTISDANNIGWRGTVAGSYGGGSANEFNSGWTAASGVGDFNFQAFTLQNSTLDIASLLPSGYDQYATLGWAYNNASSNLEPFIQRDRCVQPIAKRDLGSFTASVGTLTSLATCVPHMPLRVWIAGGNSSAGQAQMVGPVPDGFALTTSEHRSAGAMYGTNVKADVDQPNLIGSIITECQRAYFRTNSGTAKFFLDSWEW